MRVHSLQIFEYSMLIIYQKLLLFFFLLIYIKSFREESVTLPTRIPPTKINLKKIDISWYAQKLFVFSLLTFKSFAIKLCLLKELFSYSYNLVRPVCLRHCFLRKI